MKKIEVITRPEKLVGLKEIFATHNCQGMTCLSVMGCGRQKGYLPEMNFTGDDINLLPKIMVFVVVEDDQIEEILADIATAIGTGKNGDGKVFVTEVGSSKPEIIRSVVVFPHPDGPNSVRNSPSAILIFMFFTT